MVAFPVAHIRIVGIPPGEAPLSIRKEWVGLVLPLASHDRSAYQVETCGVVSGVKSKGSTIGYLVHIEDALAVLAKTAPHAASWWRKHAGRLVAEGGNLIFHEHVCELVDGGKTH